MNRVFDFIRNRLQGRPNLARIIGNVGWLSFDKFFRMGIGVFVTILVARYLGAERFGLLSYAGSFVALFGVIASAGLQHIVVREIVGNNSSEGNLIGTSAAIQLFAGTVAYLGLISLTEYIGSDDPVLRATILILGITLPFKAAESVKYWFEAKVRSKYVVWALNSAFVITAGTKLALVLLEAPVIYFAYAMAGESVIGAVALMVLFTFKGLRIRSLKLRWVVAVRLLKASWPLALSGIAVIVYMKIDQLMLGYMIGNEAVGIYSVAVRLSEIWYFIPMAIVASVFPAIISAKSGSARNFYQRVQQLYDLMVLLAVCVAVPMTFLSDLAVTTLFGEEFAKAGMVLSLHVWAAVFVFLGVASGRVYVAENAQVISLQRSLLGALVNVVLNLLLIPSYGPVGAALATLVSYSIAALLFDSIQERTRTMFFMKLRALNVIAASQRLFVGESR